MLCAIVFEVAAAKPDIYSTQFDVQSENALVVQEAARSGGDGLTVLRIENPLINNKHGRQPMATGEHKSNYQPETEIARTRVSRFREKEFYDLPPNDYGYNGISFANQIRDQPQNT